MTVSKNIHKTYSEDFKRDAVRLAGERGNISADARDLGIDGSNLRSWIRLVKSESDHPFPGKGNPQHPELAALLKENARLREDNDILKKAVGIFTKLPSSELRKKRTPLAQVRLAPSKIYPQ